MRAINRNRMFMTIVILALFAMLDSDQMSPLYQRTIHEGELRIIDYYATSGEALRVIFYSPDHHGVYLTVKTPAGDICYCVLNYDGSFDTVISYNVHGNVSRQPTMVVTSDTAAAPHDTTGLIYLGNLGLVVPGTILSLPPNDQMRQKFQNKINALIERFGFKNNTDDEPTPPTYHVLDTPYPARFIS